MNKIVIVFKDGKVREYSNTDLSSLLDKLQRDTALSYALVEILSITQMEIKD